MATFALIFAFGIIVSRGGFLNPGPIAPIPVESAEPIVGRKPFDQPEHLGRAEPQPVASGQPRGKPIRRGEPVCRGKPVGRTQPGRFGQPEPLGPELPAAPDAPARSRP